MTSKMVSVIPLIIYFMSIYLATTIIGIVLGPVLQRYTE